MSKAQHVHSSPCTSNNAGPIQVNTYREIGQSKPTKIVPLLAVTTFVFGILGGIVLPSIVEDENKQSKVQLYSDQRQEASFQKVAIQSEL